MKDFLNSLKYKRESSRIFFHILFWLLYIVFFTAHYGSMYIKPDYLKLFLNMSIHVWVVSGSAYFLIYYLFPKFLFKKKYGIFAILFLLSVLITILLYRAIGFYIAFPLLFPNIIEGKSYWDIYPLFDFLIIYSVIGLFGMIKLLRYRFISQNEKLELEKQNKESELLMLRNQLNPHFLFNTLNNIDTLISRNQNKASEAVIMLSDIMRYMLYESNEGTVSLDQEIKYLKSYISLQKLRLSAPNSVSMQITGANKDTQIAPMLLIPFVENAFKHTKKAKDFFIDIRINSTENHLKFSVKNSKSTEETGQKDETGGIGLLNVKRRLELIYPQKHKLKISDMNDFYSVELIINH